MDWFPGPQCISLMSKNQQKQIKLRFQDSSDIPKILGQLITHFHPFMFLLDCFRLAQAMRDDVSLVTEQLVTYNLEARQYPYCTFSLSPPFSLTVHDYMTDYKTELRIPIHQKNIFYCKQPREASTRSPLSISLSFLDFTLPFPCHSQPTQNRTV